MAFGAGKRRFRPENLVSDRFGPSWATTFSTEKMPSTSWKRAIGACFRPAVTRFFHGNTEKMGPRPLEIDFWAKIRHGNFGRFCRYFPIENAAKSGSRPKARGGAQPAPRGPKRGFWAPGPPQMRYFDRIFDFGISGRRAKNGHFGPFFPLGRAPKPELSKKSRIDSSRNRVATRWFWGPGACLAPT